MGSSFLNSLSDDDQHKCILFTLKSCSDSFRNHLYLDYLAYQFSFLFQQ